MISLIHDLVIKKEFPLLGADVNSCFYRKNINSMKGVLKKGN